MPQSCSCCGKQTEAHLILKCCVCQNLFSNACVGISSSETRLINAKKSLTWTCNMCHQLGSDINALKAALISLQNEVKALKSASTGSTNNNDLLEEVISEITDRQRRKKNLLIFNIKEQQQQLSEDDRSAAEENIIRNVIKAVVPSASSKIVKFHRLGKFNPTKNRPRPIKVIMSNEGEVISLCQKSKCLKQLNEYKDIFFASDKTPKQLEYFNKVKNELLERKNNGEENIKIIFSNDTPKIVTTNNLN